MEELIIGIDEAGRGPVIGPMVICGIMMKKKNLPKLVDMGVKDSKLLSPTRREKLRTWIEKVAERWELINISPSRIDACGIMPLQLQSIAHLINRFSPHVAIIDSPTRWPESFTRKIRAFLNDKKVKLVVETFADRKYSIVSAASILAKVARDESIKNLSLLYGNMGSGYPSDQKTVDFLKRYLQENRPLPNIVRKKWKTIGRINMIVQEEQDQDE